jgi:tetratricopeptide (TPR) repeat protein
VLPDEELRRIKGEAGAGEQEDYDFCLQQARAAVEAIDFASAEAWSEKAVAVEPAGPDGFNLLGGLRELRGDRLQAQKYYQAALALDPGHLPARSNLRRSTELSAGGTPDLGGGKPPVPRGRGLRSAKRSRLGKEPA